MASRRLDRRQGFLISATIHLMILTLLAYGTEKATRPTPAPSPSPRVAEKRDTFMVPPATVRRLLRPQPMPVVPAPPPAPHGKDRISIGPPSTERAKRLELKRDEDLTNQPSGPGGPTKAGLPSPPPPAAPQPQATPAVASSDPVGAHGPGLTTLPEGTQPSGPGSQASISRSLRELDRRLGQMGTGTTTGGVGQQMGPLFFDPEGADFTGWINHFKNEVYRNWIVPEAVRFGYARGHVDFEFWVERDGRLTDLRLLKSSGTPALDRSAQNALMGSRFLALPSDFAPPRVRMQVSFFYNEGPQG